MARQIDVETAPSLLVRLCNQSDASAWSEFTEVYGPLIYAYCRRRGLAPEDAADVSQEVLLRICKSIERFEYDRRIGRFRDWVARIVQNEIHRWRGSHNRTDVPVTPENTPETNQLWDEHFHQYILQAAMDRTESRFTQETWQLFRQSWVEQLPSAEVAMRNGVPISSVYVARSRVLKRLKYEVALLVDNESLM